MFGIVVRSIYGRARSAITFEGRFGSGGLNDETRQGEEAVAFCIPCQYHHAVSKQIAVRLPEEVVDFIDREVDQRHIESRASFVLKALERERRRLIAARDAEILAERTTADDDFDALAAHVSTFELDID
jgi:Arc/MetJ-type ribon-helix-helix transcriptional regulator